ELSGRIASLPLVFNIDPLLQPGYVADHFARCLVAFVARFRENLVDDPLQFVGRVRHEFLERGRLRFQYRVEHAVGRPSLKREASGAYLVSDDAKAEEVAALVNRLAANLFRRKIAVGPRRPPYLGGPDRQRKFYSPLFQVAGVERHGAIRINGDW